jgi:ABC-2 type transport system permease protein
LIGKIAAGTVLGLLQLTLWMVCGFLFGDPGGGAAGSAVGQSPAGIGALLTGDLLSPLTLCAFLAFFLLGLLQLSTLFAGVASMINRTEDIGSLATPLILPVMIALFVAIAAIAAPDSPWAVATSFVPIISPFVMFVRIAVGSVPAWQIALSISTNLAALALIAWGAGRIYRVGMLFYGRAPSLAQIWKALRVA